MAQQMSKICQNLLIKFTLLVLTALFMLGCQTQAENAGNAKKGTGSTEPLILQAAASTQDALNEIILVYNAKSHVIVQMNYASSATLAQQIMQGAPADLFLSANSDWMDRLEPEQLIAQRKDLLGNELVLVVPVDSKRQAESFEQLIEEPLEFFALADPESVPAGIYGKQVLEKTGLWEPLAERIVRGADVRQTLMFVERGEADCGIVYATDAAASKKVRVLFTIDQELYEQIVYPLGLIKQSPEGPEAQELYEYLSSPAATKVFKKYGFQPLSSTLKTKNTSTD